MFVSMYVIILVLWCCSSASNRIISAKDHASIQINIAEVWTRSDGLWFI